MKMKASSMVRLHAVVSIDPEQWSTFELQLAETKKIVKEEDDAIIHECYRQSGTHQCLIVEAYKSEAALLKHLERIQTIRDKYPRTMLVHRMDLAGEYSMETLRLFKDTFSDSEVSHYEVFLSSMNTFDTR